MLSLLLLLKNLLLIIYIYNFAAVLGYIIFYLRLIIIDLSVNLPLINIDCLYIKWWLYIK